MKALKYLIIVPLFVVICIYISCKKDNRNEVTTNALVVFTGDLAVDGCGWLIKVNDNTDGYYHPDSLANNLKIDSLPVKITYTRTASKFYCGYTPPGGGLPVIHISSIEVRN